MFTHIIDNVCTIKFEYISIHFNIIDYRIFYSIINANIKSKTAQNWFRYAQIYWYGPCVMLLSG